MKVTTVATISLSIGAGLMVLVLVLNSIMPDPFSVLDIWVVATCAAFFVLGLAAGVLIGRTEK